jgi:hypothetical protein
MRPTCLECAPDQTDNEQDHAILNSVKFVGDRTVVKAGQRSVVDSRWRMA